MPWLRSSTSTSTRSSLPSCIFTLAFESSTWTERRPGCASESPRGSTSMRCTRFWCCGSASRTVISVLCATAPAGMVSVLDPALSVAPALPTVCTVDGLPPPQAASASEAARTILLLRNIMEGSWDWADDQNAVPFHNPGSPRQGTENTAQRLHRAQFSRADPDQLEERLVLGPGLRQIDRAIEHPLLALSMLRGRTGGLGHRLDRAAPAQRG